MRGGTPLRTSRPGLSLGLGLGLLLLWPGQAAASQVPLGPLGGVLVLSVMASPLWLISLAATLVSAVKGRVNLVARVLAVLDMAAVFLLLVAVIADPPKTSDDWAVTCVVGGLPLAVAAWTFWIGSHPRARPPSPPG